MVTWSGDAGWYPVDVWSDRAWLRGNPAASIDKCRLEAPTSASRLPGSDVCFPVEALWFNFFCGEGCGTYGVFGLGENWDGTFREEFWFFFFFLSPGERGRENLRCAKPIPLPQYTGTRKGVFTCCQEKHSLLLSTPRLTDR